MTPARWVKLRGMIAVPLVFSLMIGVAWAYWSTSSVPGGNGASAATSVNQGATPTASAVGGAVTVSWAATTLASGQAVTGYVVKRYDAITPFAAQTILSSCTGTVAATSCVENSVPAGSWKYTVTPKIGTNWAGPESLKSSTVVIAAPVLTATGSTLAYTENATPLLDSGITAADTEAGTLTSATVTMTTAYVNGQDTLAFTTQNGITGTWTPSTGVLALTGTATLANYQTALRSITYNNNSDNPDITTRTVTFSANDGSFTSNTDSRTITLTAVNDPPVNSVPGSQTTATSSPLVFSSGNGNLISISDPDAGAGTMQVQLISTNGTSTLSGTGGLTFSVGDGTADGAMTFTGTITNINLRLAGLGFTPSAAGAGSLQIITSDQGNTGTGGTLTDNDTITITTDYGLFTTAADIGAGAAGPDSSTYASSAYTEIGNGTDIYNASDQFHYLYKSWTGDGTIIARVTALGNTDPNARAGVMFRETTGTGSAEAMMGVHPASNNTVTFEHRDTTGGSTTTANTGGVAPTVWLKLVRSGNTFTGYSAPDSSGSPGTWTSRGSQSVTMASTILVGLATLSHSATVTTTATYDNVGVSLDTTGPTGGSADATGLTGTGSRYSTSTTLSIALSKGTDPAGVETTGNQLQRATATLTSGTCGSYGSYALITGGSDPATPKSDTVTAGSCYSYHYIVLDFLGNATTYSSPDIKVDTSTPATPTLAYSALTNAYASGNTVYYQPSAVAGAFTATASSTDPVAGIASYAFPSLGTGWTGVPGALGVNSYSWSGTPAVPGSQNVSATSNSGATSANVSFTPTADSTAPSADTISYTNGYTAGLSISVTFTTTATDAGSGIASRQIQRASATLTNGSCGTYGGFANIGSANPASPYNDTSLNNSHCYQYQYVVSDNVGNQQINTSASVAEVDYAGAVANTAGLVSQWRLGETKLATDSFTDTSATALASHTGQVGATWTKRLGVNAVITDANRLRINAVGEGVYYASAAPASADYSVSADVLFKSTIDDAAGVVGRLDTTNASGTYYEVDYRGTGFNQWQMYKRVNGTYTAIGSAYAQTLTAGQSYRVELNMTGSAISASVNGTIRISATDSAITAAGRPGVLLGCPACTAASTNTTGYHLDNFSVTPASVDSKGSNTGNYVGNVTLGTTGAITGDSNTAATLDGTTSFVQALTPTGLPTGNSVRSAETWFKTTNTGGQMLFDYGTESNAQEFGLALTSGQQSMFAWGYAQDYSYNLTSSVTDGNWHHVVETYNGTSITLYVDGIGLTPQTVSVARNTVVNADGFMIGAYYETSIPGWTYMFTGSIDDVSLYSTTLSAATVTNHYALGTH